ncbi:MAG: LysM peptidoglycan-binding domain-containing protein [Treponema sp.]|nr:LysM peptidoglycan-binding domain-containing protein [Treponema sp.]
MSENANRVRSGNVQNQTPQISNKLRFIDILVLVVFISTAIYGLYLFRQDLMQTFDARDMEPAGIIVVRNNVVQRRHADRVAWDRIFVDSPVYPGDLIRAAELSSTNIDIANNEIFLNENTLIRIQQTMGGMGNFLVELREGNLSVTSNSDSEGIVLDLMGSQVLTSSGTVLSAEVGDEGIAVQVNEGKAEFIQEGQAREISEGAMIALDTQGVERVIPAAVVMRPVTNARYLNNRPQPLQINFSWNRINLEEGETLRLEIASDANFSIVLRTLTGLNNSAQMSFSSGRWHWRLAFEDTILSRGQFTIVDSFGTTIISPVIGSLFRYHDAPPQIRFQWAETEGASRYLIEINNTQDFSAPAISRESNGASLILSQMEAGTWYWRVKPVFPLVFEGESSFSSVASFRIERTENITAPAIEIPVIPVERAAVIAAPVVATAPAQPAASAQAPAPAPRQDAIIRPQTVRSVTGARRFHTVQAGETLGRIARQYYNDAMQWNRISDANNITNPDLIHPGEVFLIP